MLTIPGYEIIEQIHASENSLVYRSLRLADEIPVIIKLLNQDYPTPEALTRYKQEYEITRSLHIDRVIKTYGLEKYRNTLVILLEDFGGQSLKTSLSPTNAKSYQDFCRQFLHIAIHIADTLSQIHAANIIHKDINPSNILWNPTTGIVKIIDFGISTVLTRENPTLKNPEILEGTLPYISPEQTGRMNRALDYRSDFYSLGATFYELLSGQLPFEAEDALEFVYAHIAKQPVPLQEINPHIPKPLGDIVMKLLAKTAEERYQSGLGLKADLQECRRQLEANGIISEFPLGSQDISDKFQINQKLYGREAEIASLLEAFSLVAPPENPGNSANPVQPVMMLVAGYSGVGKSALVAEVHKPMTQSRGYFIAGKFDQYQRNIPYYGFIKAFSELIKQLLGEKPTSLAEWRERLETALGENGGVITQLIPDLELIIGAQPAVPELSPQETQNRLNQQWLNFIGACASPSHPLVIFIDDLQWADSASLSLMQKVILDLEAPILVIGAYRDNEVGAAHPLMTTVGDIKDKNRIVREITLPPLGDDSVLHLIADTLNCSGETAQPLAELVGAKTGGNPFFMTEFLKYLYTEKLLDFDYGQRGWRWDLEEIRLAKIADNAVELMAAKMQKLPEEAREVLQLAACIGNQFDLKDLAVIAQKSLQATALCLREGAIVGLVLPLSDSYKFIELGVDVEGGDGLKPNYEPGRGLKPNYGLVEYKFAHDRIQQAAYAAIPEAEKQQVHWQLGRLLLQNLSPEERERKIFDLVNQLNRGEQLIQMPSERNQLAELNLIAGKKAKGSGAYPTALSYLQFGISLLEANPWQQQYELTANLHLEAAEAAYLCGMFVQMEELVKVVLTQSQELLDQVRAYEIRLQALKAQNQPREAISTALQTLKLLGVKLPKKPTKLQILLSLAKTKLALAKTSIPKLIHLPINQNPYQLAVLRLVSSVAAAVYIAAPEWLPVLMSTSMLQIIKYGNSPLSPYTCATYSVILCGVVNDINSGYQLGQVALNLVSRFNPKDAKTLYLVNAFAIHWKEPLRHTLKPLQQAYHIGVENGDLQYGPYSAYVYSIHAYFAGGELPQLAAEMAAYRQELVKLKQQTAIQKNNLFYQVVLNLTGDSSSPWVLAGDIYDENQMVPLHQQAKDINALMYLYLNKCIIAYLFEQIDLAEEYAALTAKYLKGVTAMILVPIFHFYDSLVALAMYNKVGRPGQKLIWQRVQKNQKKMKKWAKHAPANHLHKYLLVAAEQHRIKGKYLEAESYYNRAIALAKQHEYIQEEALANELTAKFYLERNLMAVASVYFYQARYSYQLWGAEAKVNQLDAASDLMISFVPTPAGKSKDVTTRVGHTTSTGSGVALDVATVVKASQALSGEINLDELLSKFMKLIMENAGAQTGFMILLSGEELILEVYGQITGDEVATRRDLPLDGGRLLEFGPINYVARTQEDLVLGNATQEGMFTQEPYVLSRQILSLLCAPIVHQGQLLGILYLENNLTVEAFTPERLALLKVISAQAAISIENALLYRTLEQKVIERTAQLAAANQEIRNLNQMLQADNIRMSAELDVTRRLQQMMSPKPQEMSQIEELDIAGFMEPASEVGGDYYDVLQLDGKVKIGIGDVTGHGLESGMLMIMAQMAVRTLLESGETDPVRFLDFLNRAIYKNVARMESDKNMTLALLDYSEGTLTVSGQHESVVVVRGGAIGEPPITPNQAEPIVEIIDTIDLGFPLGLDAEIAPFIATTSVQLNPGDVVLLYTDGITEAENILGEQYGLERLIAAAKPHCHLTSEEIRQNIIFDLRQHIGTNKVYDDITLVVLKQR
ncbi:MAG TPA: AAA family ATPase [Oscillatoriaceae cyanobacterium M33_DOE_052]|uniref:GAF domain-containing protein n=1 Tax=Planktothricoides sp. SpSt-374 TaxID=2282167 RepID=A0A7C3VKE0_9CYAN|nr:AAA family ATPase [Oscillatoriaceae cyanobacterium M33_DOE_052]